MLFVLQTYARGYNLNGGKLESSHVPLQQPSWTSSDAFSRMKDYIRSPHSYYFNQ
jgi:hypothetical protein